MARSARLLTGLVLFGLALALLVHADLGLDPWTVFSAGLARHLHLTLGEVTVGSSVAVLLLWIPLRQRPGIGTVANALMVGPVLDLGVALLSSPHHLVVRVLFLVLGLVLVALGTGLYVGVGWGPGPRDGLMTGMVELGVPLYLARTLIEGHGARGRLAARRPCRCDHRRVRARRWASGRARPPPAGPAANAYTGRPQCRPDRS